MKSSTTRRNGARSSKAPSKASAPETIYFYRANEKPYGVFSNLFARAIVFEGREYATAEHAYQAGKARREQVREWILSAPSPALVAMAAHGLYTWDITPEWSRTKYDRMRAVLRAKFSQHDDLREILLSTGKARLVEAGTVANPVNLTWGEVNGKGKNMLGVMLMELRDELKKKSSSPKSVSRARSRATKAPAKGWHKSSDAVTA